MSNSFSLSGVTLRTAASRDVWFTTFQAHLLGLMPILDLCVHKKIEQRGLLAGDTNATTICTSALIPSPGLEVCTIYNSGTAVFDVVIGTGGDTPQTSVPAGRWFELISGVAEDGARDVHLSFGSGPVEFIVVLGWGGTA